MKILLIPAVLTLVMAASCNGCERTGPSSQVPGGDLLVDSLKYEVVDADKQWGDCDKGEDDCVSVILEYPLVKGEDSQARAMNGFIQQWLLGNLRDSLNTPEQLADSYINEYQRLKKARRGFKEGWQIEKVITVLTNHHGLFCLRLEELEQTGAANPNLQTSFVNYNLKSGRQLQLGDFLTEGFEDSLNSLAEFYFRQSRELSFEDDLEKAGFDFRNNKFNLNSNFVLDETGLTFSFNRFEVAPASTGLSEFTIPYAELVKSNLIKPEGPLAFLISEPAV